MGINKNVGTADRVLRLGTSAMMIYFGFFNDELVADSLAAMLLGGFGIIILVTAVISMCPLYNIIGLNTCSKAGTND